MNYKPKVKSVKAELVTDKNIKKYKGRAEIGQVVLYHGECITVLSYNAFKELFEPNPNSSKSK